MAPSAAGLGTATTTSAEAGHGVSAPAGVDCRTFGRNRSPPLVLTMFRRGADENGRTATGPKGRSAQDEFKKKMKMKRRRGRGLKGGLGKRKGFWFNLEMQEDEKAFGSAFRASKFRASKFCSSKFRVSKFRALCEFCADASLNKTHLQDKTK